MSTPLIYERVPSVKAPALRRKPQLRRTSRAPVAQPGQSRGCLLYGGLAQVGVSMEWHDFELAGPLDCSASFHPGALNVCLNLTGQGTVDCGAGTLTFAPFTAGIFLLGSGPIQAVCQAGQRHRFALLAFSVRYLRERLAGCDGALHPLVEAFMRDGARASGVGELHRLSTEQERFLAELVNPPVFEHARPLWYQSKVLQLMVDFFFERRGEDELPCDRQKRLARERSERVMAILRARLAEPPSLEAIGREVGCSPFYLSRTFSQATGMTIPQYLRKLRMERAAELLQSGKHNVTEAALEVGYSSLSHFSQAFCQVMGCCPGLYPFKGSSS